MNWKTKSLFFIILHGSGLIDCAGPGPLQPLPIPERSGMTATSYSYPLFDPVSTWRPASAQNQVPGIENEFLRLHWAVPGTVYKTCFAKKCQTIIKITILMDSGRSPDNCPKIRKISNIDHFGEPSEHCQKMSSGGSWYMHTNAPKDLNFLESKDQAPAGLAVWNQISRGLDTVDGQIKWTVGSVWSIGFLADF